MWFMAPSTSLVVRCGAATVALVLSSCGGRTIEPVGSTGEETDGGAERVACRTSFGCADGLRCESGRCVADQTCPEHSEAEILSEATPGSYWAQGTPGIAVIESDEYLVGSVDSVLPPPTSKRFLHLLSGTERELDHPPGLCTCVGGASTAWCAVRRDDGFSLLTGIGPNADGATFDIDRSRDYSIAGSIWLNDADLRDGHLAVFQSALVNIVDLDTGRATDVVPIAERRFVALLPDASGISRRVVALGTGDGIELAVAAIDSNPTWRTVYAGPPTFSAIIAIPIGTDEFVILRDGPAQGDPTQVVWTGDDPPSVVEFSEPAIAAIDPAYFQGRPVEPGPAVFAFSCDLDNCESFRIHLDNARVETIAAVELPDEGAPLVTQRRWLACGAVEAIVRIQRGDGSVAIWKLKLPGREASD